MTIKKKKIDVYYKKKLVLDQLRDVLKSNIRLEDRHITFIDNSVIVDQGRVKLRKFNIKKFFRCCSTHEK